MGEKSQSSSRKVETTATEEGKQEKAERSSLFSLLYCHTEGGMSKSYQFRVGLNYFFGGSKPKPKSSKTQSKSKSVKIPVEKTQSSRRDREEHRTEEQQQISQQLEEINKQVAEKTTKLRRGDQQHIQQKSIRRSITLFSVNGYHGHRKGEREDMQDAHVIEESFQSTADIRRLAYYAVFDGHNGPRAAEFAAQKVHTNLMDRLDLESCVDAVEPTLKRKFIEAYKVTDEQFLLEAAKCKPSWKDGTTATTVLLINNNLFIANLGDSKAILCRFKKEESREIALTLTKDHSPQVFEERMRIQKAGGTVKDGRILGILEVSRSIGDGQYKNHGVSCTPDVKKCALTENDRYVLN